MGCFGGLKSRNGDGDSFSLQPQKRDRYRKQGIAMVDGGAMGKVSRRPVFSPALISYIAEIVTRSIVEASGRGALPHACNQHGRIGKARPEERRGSGRTKSRCAISRRMASLLRLARQANTISMVRLKAVTFFGCRRISSYRTSFCLQRQRPFGVWKS